MTTATDFPCIECDMLLHPETRRQLDRQFECEGWIYAIERDETEDTRTRCHYLICDEAVKEIDWSPYQTMTYTEVRAWLKFGCPKRQNIRPLNTMDLLHLAVERAGRAA